MGLMDHVPSVYSPVKTVLHMKVTALYVLMDITLKMMIQLITSHNVLGNVLSITMRMPILGSVKYAYSHVWIALTE